MTSGITNPRGRRSGSQGTGARRGRGAVLVALASVLGILWGGLAVVMPPEGTAPAAAAAVLEDPVPVCGPGVVGTASQFLADRCYAPAYGYDGLGPASFPATISFAELGFTPSSSAPFTVSWSLPFPNCNSTEPIFPCVRGENPRDTYSLSPRAWAMNRGNHSYPGIRSPDHSYCQVIETCQAAISPLVDYFGTPTVKEMFPGDDLIVQVQTSVDTSPTTTALLISQQRYELAGGGVEPPPEEFDDPTASFTVAATKPGSRTWSFDASASEAFDGATIDEYRWDFGDKESATPEVTTTPTTEHTYAEPGTYTATLTVEDSRGQTGTTTREVEIHDPGLIVNSVADAPNGAESGTRCDTGNTVGDVPECTLRAAIEAANAGADDERITFAIDVVGTPQITLASDLPAVDTAVAIDGTTQPGGWVALHTPSDTITGLRLHGANASVEGMVVSGFRLGVVLRGNGTEARGNHIGVNAAGTAANSPGDTAVVIGVGSGIVVADNVLTASAFGIQAIQQSSGTISGNKLAVSASGATALGDAPTTGVLLRDVGAWTLTDNVIRHRVSGIHLRGASTTGSAIEGNQIGVNANATASVASTGYGVLIDGVPGARVADNDVRVDGTAGIAVTGRTVCEQVQEGACTLRPPGKELAGPVTGGNVIVERNRVGLVAGSTSGAGTYGIAVYGGAPDVTVRDNHVAGHRQLISMAGADVLIAGATDARVFDNSIGTNAAGTSAFAGDTGIRIAGSTGTVVHGNHVAGQEVTGIEVTSYRPTTGGSTLQSTDTLLRSNRIGTNAAGTSALPNNRGIDVTESSAETGITDNVVSGNTLTGVQIRGQATDTAVIDNTIGSNASGSAAIPNYRGIAVADQAAKTSILDNVVAGNTTTGIQLRTSDATLVSGNSIGLGPSGTAVPNGVGVDVEGDAAVSRNTVFHNTGAGVSVVPGSRAWLRENRTYDNGGPGIAGPVAPPAPKLDVVHATWGDEARTWFVIDTLSAEHVVELFANPDCSQPDEGRDPVEIEHVMGLGPRQLLVVKGDVKLDAGYTATVTVLAAGKSSFGLGLASTSEYSNCAVPAAYPDTSGTGIPDIVQRALGGTPADPTGVTFPGDGGTPISLHADAGRFEGVHPVTAPVGADDVTFPAGLFSFRVTGLTPGAAVDVTALTQHDAASYWRHGPPIPGAAARWYRWDHDDTTGIGARALRTNEAGLGRTWVLSFVDGEFGDDDFSANGTVVDPGGPGIELAGVPPVSEPVPPTIPEPAPPTGGASALPRTGRDGLIGMAIAGVVAVLAGLILVRSSPRRPRTTDGSGSG